MRTAVVVAVMVIAACSSVLATDALSPDGSPSPADTFDLDPAFATGVSDPTDFRWLPDGRMILLSKEGDVWIRPASGGALVAAGSLAVDTGQREGLLGVAADPQFAANARNANTPSCATALRQLVDALRSVLPSAP